MIYAYDTEFHEDGKTIDLISIGIVAEDAREYYAVNSDADWDRIAKHEWLWDNVVPQLPAKFGRERRQDSDTSERPGYWLDTTDPRVKPRWVIANEVREFLLGGSSQPEMWADYAAYDHVALCQLWGSMIDLPVGIPMFTRDLQQELARTGATVPEQSAGVHNALADARHVMTCLRHLGIARDHPPINPSANNPLLCEEISSDVPAQLALTCDRPHGHTGLHRAPGGALWGTDQQAKEEHTLIGDSLTTYPRRLQLHRDHDVTGVSGTGIVADGVRWPDGSATIRWRGPRASTVHWDSLEDAIAVHGHGGHTRIVWIDPE